MRILTLTSPNRLRGAERYCGRLCAWAATKGHEFIVGVRSEGAVADWYRELGLDVRALGFRSRYNPLPYVPLRKLLREFKPDVIHTHLSAAAVWGSLVGKGAGIPCVCHAHSIGPKASYRLATRVIAVSHAVKSNLVEQGMSADRIEVVWPAFDELEATHAAADIAALGSKVVVCAAFLKKAKGVLVLLDAWERVRAEVPEAVLAFAGEGPELARMQRIAADRGYGGSVRFLGFRNDMPAVFAAARCAVLPSISGEGLPGVIAEANSVGVPAIGSDISGIPEIIQDGKTGFLTPPGDPAALADKLIRVLCDDSLHQTLAAAALGVSANFTMEKSGSRCIEVFESLRAR